MKKRNRNNNQATADFAEFKIKEDGTAEATINCEDDDVCKQFEEYISKFEAESGIKVTVSRREKAAPTNKKKINKKLVFGIAGGVLAATAGAVILKQVFSGHNEVIPQPAADTAQPAVDEIATQVVNDLGMDQTPVATIVDAVQTTF